MHILRDLEHHYLSYGVCALSDILSRKLCSDRAQHICGYLKYREVNLLTLNLLSSIYIFQMCMHIDAKHGQVACILQSTKSASLTPAVGKNNSHHSCFLIISLIV